MTARKLIILLLSAALILTLFLTRTRSLDSPMEIEYEVTPAMEQYLYISPFDSLFRLYADSVCDWKMLAAIAYVESKFDTAAASHTGEPALKLRNACTGRCVKR